MFGLIAGSYGDWAGIHNEVSINEIEVVVIDVKSASSCNSGDTQFVGIGSDAFSRACGNIHRKHTLQRHGIDGLAIWKDHVASISQPIIENGESGFAYI